MSKPSNNTNGIEVENVLKTFMSMVLLAVSLISFDAKATGSFAGGGAGNGAKIFDAAWFTEHRTINWCIAGENQLGVPTPQVIATISKAFAIWNEYLDAKGLQENLPSKLNPNELSPRLFAGQKFHQDCYPMIDLVFYLGPIPQVVADAKAKYYDTAIAFSHSIGYSIEKGRGLGFIWIRGAKVAGEEELNWADTRNLLGIFLHELGHVFGCQHVDGTIMHKNIASTIRRKEELPKVQEKFEAGLYSRDFLTGIDFERELYFMPILQFAGLSNARSNPDHVASFEFLTGRKPLGDSSIFVFQKRYTMEPQLYAFDQLETVNPTQSEFQIQMNDMVTPLNNARFSDAHIFKVIWRGGAQWWFPSVMSNRGVLDLNGRSLPVRWLRNHAFNGVNSEIEVMKPDFSTLKLVVTDLSTRDELVKSVYQKIIQAGTVPRFGDQ
jgi:hypothetical protein